MFRRVEAPLVIVEVEVVPVFFCVMTPLAF